MRQVTQKCALGPFCQMADPHTNRQPVNLYCLKVSNLFRELILLLESVWTLPGLNTRHCWVLHPRQLRLCCSLCAGMLPSSKPNHIFVDMWWALWSLSKLPISSDFVSAISLPVERREETSRRSISAFWWPLPHSEFSVPRTSVSFCLLLTWFRTDKIANRLFFPLVFNGVVELELFHVKTELL